MKKFHLEEFIGVCIVFAFLLLASVLIGLIAYGAWFGIKWILELINFAKYQSLIIFIAIFVWIAYELKDEWWY